MALMRVPATLSYCAALMLAIIFADAPANAQLFWRPATPAAGVSVNEIDAQGRTDLVRVDQYLANQKWEEAVQTLRRVMQTQGDRLIALQSTGNRRAPEATSTDGFVTYLPVRMACQMKLAECYWTAPEALRVYRKRVDPLAGKWFAEASQPLPPQTTQTSGGSLHRRRRLAELVDRFWMSSYGDDALNLLGEFALQKGEFALARQCWERISPLFRWPTNTAATDNHRSFSLGAVAGTPLWVALQGVDLNKNWPLIEAALSKPSATPSNWPAYPDTDLNLADIRARIALCCLLDPASQRGPLELSVLRRLHPEARGKIGGKEGRYIDLLKPLLQNEDLRPSSDLLRANWTTFAGDVRRRGQAPHPVDIAGAAVWSSPLRRITALQERIGLGRTRVAEGSEDLLSYHPVLIDDLVLVAGPRYLQAISARSGRAAWPVEKQSLNEPDGVIYDSEVDADRIRPHHRPFIGAPRFTLSSDGRHAVAKMGPPITEPRQTDPLDQRGFLVGLELATQKLLYRIEPENEHWTFEGSPLVKAGFFYVAARKTGQVRPQTRVACYDVRTGRRLWLSEKICSAATITQGRWDEISHHLLSLAEGVLYYNTNLGGVAALSAQDGRIRWVTRYPRKLSLDDDPDRNDLHLFRDLNPCLIHQDMVIAAPADCACIFALDAATGRVLWQNNSTGGADVKFLLGVGVAAGGPRGQDHLIASGDSLCWFNLFSGKLQAQFPPAGLTGAEFARPQPRGYGRGLLAGDVVYWPTREAIYVFRQELAQDRFGVRPMPVRTIDLAIRGATGGNLASDGQLLLIAGPDRLYAFSETP